ncbi:MAG: lipoyl synthase [Actinomycetota bacterium]|nr:lipoyl synthase [Actinomycetota bacterium]
MADVTAPEAPAPTAAPSASARQPTSVGRPLRVRWLGRVGYDDALALQKGLFAGDADHLLLLEHPPTYTLGVRADLANVRVPPAEVGAELVRADRGGDVTYHGPGQVVGYPILTRPGKRGGGMADTVAYVRSVEQLVIDTLVELGLTDVGRLDDYPGVWVGPDGPAPRKIAAIGVKLSRARTMHGFALNVTDEPLGYFGHIVPCGIGDKAVTSLRAEGVDVTMREVVDVIARRAATHWDHASSERADVVWRHRSSDLTPFSRGEGAGEAVKPTRGRERPAAKAPEEPQQPAAQQPAAQQGTSVRLLGRLAEAGVTQGVDIAERKPDWMRAKARIGPDYLRLKKVMKDLDLVTVCEEAGCPNIFECWHDGTATFMIGGERCTRACGFCLVDTRKPEALDADEPARVAEAVERMGLEFAVVTAVARDDVADGGAAHFAATIRAIRSRRPGTGVEVLISDCKGDAEALDTIFEARPDVLNHNVETVPRLQRAARPSASYARSLAVLARAKAAGLVTKTSIIVGMGESFDEVVATMADLAGIGVDIVTVGQYLRPTTHHLPVARWWTPEEFAELKRIGEAELGLAHVESGPLTRSSYHARQASEAANDRPAASTATTA